MTDANILHFISKAHSDLDMTFQMQASVLYPRDKKTMVLGPNLAHGLQLYDSGAAKI